MISDLLDSILRYYLSFLEGIRENLNQKVPLNAHAFNQVLTMSFLYKGGKICLNQDIY